MDENERKTLESLGWTPELIESLKATAATEALDAAFLAWTKNALCAAGYSALEFLAANPRLPVAELARKLGPGASGMGLRMAVYEEAMRSGRLRQTAKDLLIRQICQAFPAGWSSTGNVHPSVKIGGWDYDIERYVRPPMFGDRAVQIKRDLTVDHPPPEGWFPDHPTDTLIDELFDRYWPREEGD
jgi:hypothetical protein